MSDLKPCPFCGGEAALVPTFDTTVREWFVTCGNLECSVLACRTKRYYTEAEAIAAWNSRAERVTDDEWEIYQHSVPATEEYMAKFGWVRERTCHIEGSYYDELFDETCTNLSCGHAIWQNESPNYCSECGAKVVDK